MKALSALFVVLGFAILPVWAVPAFGETCPGGKGAWCWGEPMGLLPENEWQQYVGRPSAFGASRPDPAARPLLSGTRRSTGTPRKAVAAKPKVDPCAEKIWKAFDDAAKAGKIPVEAVPPKPGTETTVSTAQPAATANPVNVPQPPAPAVSTSPDVVVPNMVPPVNPVQPTPSGGVYTPYSSSVAVPGTSAHGLAAPNPSLANPQPPDRPFATN